MPVMAGAGAPRPGPPCPGAPPGAAGAWAPSCAAAAASAPDMTMTPSTYARFMWLSNSQLEPELRGTGGAKRPRPTRPKDPALQGERPGLHRSRLTEYDPGAAGAYFSNWILSDRASARLLQPDPIPYGARVSTASTSCSRPFSTLNASAISHVHGSCGPPVIWRPSGVWKWRDLPAS